MRVTPNQLNILKLSGDSWFDPPAILIELREASSLISLLWEILDTTLTPCDTITYLIFVQQFSVYFDEEEVPF